MRKLAVLGALALFGWVAWSCVQPTAGPELASYDTGLEPSYEETYAAWEAAIERQEPERALEVVDFFLLSPGGEGEFAADARAMRQVAVARIAAGPGAVSIPSAEDRGEEWRLQRALGRLPELPKGTEVPEVYGLAPDYALVYARWLQALRAEDPGEALAVVDEYLLGGGADRAEDAHTLRALAVAAGAEGPATPEAREQVWRYQRLASRRPDEDWALLFLGGCLLVLGLFGGPRRRRQQGLLLGPGSGVGIGRPPGDPA
jgi:hypothetical protein